MKKIFLLAVIAFALVGCDNKKGAFLETVESNNDVPTSVSKFINIIEKNGLTHFSTIDHAKNAEKVNLRLKPETVVIFGNPNMGTALMKCNPSIGLDLPLKMLFSTDYEGKTTITYTNPEYWSLKHNIKDKKCLNIIKKMHIALQNLADAAAKK
ncbi:putative inner membrane or exported protein [hydrothermal vent metagenome]|uniref:Putative inner membrane or exported protein n=1 Tax=hydrothermal vent metagenome TaxID=652676 RepID=A0A1W1EFA1_9ZZZZ